MTAWWIALQFLTRLPVSLSAMPEPRQIGRSLLFYPAVGLLIGGLLWAVQALTEGAPLLLQAALLLTVWVAVTGALHLDGLADSADAWVGGLGDVDRTLRIMKDPASGPIAVVSLVLLLLLKFAAIVAILEAGHGLYLLLAPWVARVLLPLLLLTTPYLRAGGLGSALVEHMPRTALRRVIVLNVIVVALTGWAGLVALVVGGCTWAILRRLMLRRLGGCTGDTAGALVEICECTVVLFLAL